MPRRKELANVAGGLLGSFVSRNNDLNGYWALGKLFARALELDVLNFRFDLMRATDTEITEEFVPIAYRYRQMLANQLEKRKMSFRWLRSASIEVHFTRSFTGQGQFECSVTIGDDLGRTVDARSEGLCWAHNASKERRR